MAIPHLKRRAEYLRVARDGQAWSTHGLVLQMWWRGGDKGEAVGATDSRIGITVTRKVGNAVVRNRVRRRLRAVAEELLPTHGQAGYDYVLVGRAGSINRPFPQLREDLQRALARLRAGEGRRSTGGRRRASSRDDL